MELFSIICTTCKSRLNVRDRAAIGQILACPKCGGMVMVKPPPAWIEAGEQKSDLPTATGSVSAVVHLDRTLHSSAFDVVDELLSDSPPKVQPPPRFTPSPEPAAAPKPRFVGGPPAHRSPPPSATPPGTPPGAGPAGPSVSSKAIPAAPPAAVVPPPPSPGAVGKQEPQSQVAGSDHRHWIFMAASVALGVVLAFAAVTAAIYLVPRTDARAARPRAPTIHTPRPPAAQEPAHQSSDSATAVALPSEASPTASDSPPTHPPSTESALATPPATRDPLGLLDAPPAPVATTAASDPLARLERLIDAADDPLPKAADSSSARPSAPAAPVEPARPPAPRPPPREVDVARRLADPLSGIETTGTPLADFLQLLSDLSTIPMTLELPLFPTTPETPVAIKLTNTTVGAALSEALAPRLEYVVVDDQLVIRRIEPEPRRAITHSVTDLARDEQEMTDLAELLKAVVEPAAWEEGEDGGTITVDASHAALVINHARAVQFQVLWAIEKLRRTRTPPLAHVLKLDPSLFRLETRWAQAKPRLDTRVSLNYSQPTRLVTILERLGHPAGVRLLVDWRDVASAGWNPAAEASLVVSDQPLTAALDALLEPLDLTWRIIDGQTIEVVTPARLAERGELEFYAVGDLIGGQRSAEVIVGNVRAALGDGSFRDAGASGEIRYEGEGKCLLAWLPQPKQRELESQLAKWRSDAAAK